MIIDKKPVEILNLVLNLKMKQFFYVFLSNYSKAGYGNMRS